MRARIWVVLSAAALAPLLLAARCNLGGVAATLSIFAPTGTVSDGPPP